MLVARANPRLGLFLTGFLLLVGALLSTAVFTALYQHTRRTSAGFATWALGLGLVGAAGSMAHGGFDLANAVRLPAGSFDFPFPVDPRGLMTFGITGIAVLTWAWLMSIDQEFRPGLAYIGYLNGALMLVLYLGRLVIFDPGNPLVLGVAALEGLVVSPFWLVRVGSALVRQARG